MPRQLCFCRYFGENDCVVNMWGCTLYTFNSQSVWNAQLTHCPLGDVAVILNQWVHGTNSGCNFSIGITVTSWWAQWHFKSPALIVYSTIYSGADQWKYQSSASLSFVRGIHRWLGNSPHKGPVTQKRFPFDDVIIGMCRVSHTSLNFCRLSFSTFSCAVVYPVCSHSWWFIP